MLVGQGWVWAEVPKLRACAVSTRDFTDRKGDIFITNGVRGWCKRTSSLGRGFLTQALGWWEGPLARELHSRPGGPPLPGRPGGWGTQHKGRVRGQFTVAPRQRCRFGKWTSLRIGCVACTANDKAIPRPGERACANPEETGFESCFLGNVIERGNLTPHWIYSFSANPCALLSGLCRAGSASFIKECSSWSVQESPFLRLWPLKA